MELPERRNTMARRRRRRSCRSLELFFGKPHHNASTKKKGDDGIRGTTRKSQTINTLKISTTFGYLLLLKYGKSVEEEGVASLFKGWLL